MWLIPKAMALIKPKMTNVQSAPCQRPDRVKAKKIGNKKVQIKVKLILEDSEENVLDIFKAIGAYTYNIKKRVTVICHLFQNSIIDVARYGTSKFTGNLNPNIRPRPTAIAE